MAQAVAAGNHFAERPDWHGLRTRLAAAYAARPVLLGETPQKTSISSGSFDRGSARALATLGQVPDRRLDGVNPVGLANGNSGQDNHAAVAGASTAGD